jgi:hypothetical protein
MTKEVNETRHEGLLERVVGRTVAEALTAHGVVAGAHGLEGLLNANAFWDRQPYGTRLYYGAGIADYLHRGALRAAVQMLTANGTVQECEHSERLT